MSAGFPTEAWLCAVLPRPHPCMEGRIVHLSKALVSPRPANERRRSPVISFSVTPQPAHRDSVHARMPTPNCLSLLRVLPCLLPPVSMFHRKRGGTLWASLPPSTMFCTLYVDSVRGTPCLPCRPTAEMDVPNRTRVIRDRPLTSYSLPSPHPFYYHTPRVIRRSRGLSQVHPNIV